MNTIDLMLDDEEATRRLGAHLAGHLPGGSIVGITGPLGAGKTTLVRALAEALGVDPRDIGSPTFALVHEYQLSGGRRVMHVDAYRLDAPTQVEDLGWHEWSADPRCITCVEWADRLEGLLDDALHIELHHCEGGRAVRVRWDQSLSDLASALASGETP